MKQRCLVLVVALFAFIGGANMAKAVLTDYRFSVGTGSLVSESGATTLYALGRTSIQNAVYSANLPFTFRFDGVNYTQISISSNGVIGLGGTVTSSGSNTLTGAGMPILAPWWDQLRAAGNRNGACSQAKLTYATSGSAPSRVFTITYANFQTYRIAGSPTLSNMQVRLYEGSNKIEFFYGGLTSTSNCNSNGGRYSVSGSIGIATSASNFISVTPSGSTATASTVTPNDNIDLGSTSVSSNVLYTFEPCNISIAGNTSQGGTAAMASGSNVFSGVGVQRGNTQTYQPFTISNSMSGCGPRTFTYAITGTNAADYQISQTNGALNNGETNTPTITFTPGDVGVRTATLTVTDNNGFNRTYNLVAQGTTRIQWTGNVAQGGTANVVSGDTLLRNVIVRRNTTQTFTPLTLRNFNTNAAAPGAAVSFSINDPSGQFTVVAPTSASLLAGQTFSPIIRFSPRFIGFQEATLTVNAEGGNRTFLLRAFGGGPGSDISANGVALNASIGLFNNLFGCVGEVANVVPLTIRSSGSEPLIIRSINFLETDTNYTQGVPRLRLVRDRFGNFIPVPDYFISPVPGVAPLYTTPRLRLPDTIPAGQTRTYYITYIGQETGKRFARAIIRTNSETITGVDSLETSFEGILNFQLFGRASGSSLSSSPNEQALKTMTFQDTRVGDSIDMSYRIYNTGDCDLRISYEKLAISAGDVQDFRLLEAFGRPIVEGVPMRDDAILRPDSSGIITVRFKPQRGGSRRATIWMQTNDSSKALDGLYERGAYYLDLYGFGKAGIDFNNLTLRPAVIGSGVSSRGVVRIVNSSLATVGIASFEFFGGEAAEFSEDATGGAWPTPTPYNLIPGEELVLGVQMTPTGLPGGRSTSLRITTTTGEIIDVAIKGEAGSQGLSVSTNRMFVGVNIAAGTEKREFLMISNTGTLPIRLTSVAIDGAGAADYRLGSLPRFVLEPNAVEYLEVTYAPTGTGPSTANLTIVSDAGTQVVTLEGEGTRNKPVDDPSAILPGRGGAGQPEITLNMGSTSSVREAAAAAAGVAFDVVRPNPARERAELVYHLSRGGDVRLELYDATGRLVRELASGTKGAGEHRLVVDVSELGAGVYHCRLATGGVEISRNVVVVK